MHNKVNRQFFGYEGPPVPGAPINLTGVSSETTATCPTLPALIPDEAPSFKFNAIFRNCSAGSYVVRWRVHLKKGFSITGGLRFQVNVKYNTEGDATSSLNVIVPQEKLEEIGWRTLDMELEKLVVIQPYQPWNQSGKRQWATVEVVLSDCEGVGVRYSGLQVEYAELSPFAGTNDEQTDKNVYKYVVRRTMKPMFTIDPMGSSTLQQSGAGSTIPISRLAWSKGGTFLAALALSDDTAYITVWDMKHWDILNPEDTSSLHEKCAVATIKHSGKENLRDLSLGLSISADAKQVAVYQEPNARQWTDGSKLCESVFRFQLLILRHKEGTSKTKKGISKTKEDTSKNKEDTSEPEDGTSEPQPEAIVNIPLSDKDETSANQATWSYVSARRPHRIFKDFVGYGTFLTETERSYSDTCDHDVAHAGASTGEYGSNRMWFVACNGIYIDIFDTKYEPIWQKTRSINLADLTPTISRRDACMAMMDMMSTNTFMWLENDGDCCSIWDLWDGSNISHIFSPVTTKSGSLTFHANSTMAISPDETMAVLANGDGILKTFYADTGIEISSRRFQGHQIEYVAFNGQNNRLFAFIRNITNHELQSWRMDPLDLSSGIPVNQVPVPVIGKTILAFFHDKRLKNEGLVCEANRSKIHCYITHGPVVAARSDAKIVCHNDTFHPMKDGQQPGTQDGQKTKVRDDQRPVTIDQNPEINNDCKDGSQEEAVGGLEEGNKQYEVKTVTELTISQNENDPIYWVIRVDVVERDLEDQNKKVAFSFVPEPWIRISAADVRRPENLQKVYFLPGQDRFVVAGIQTLQIWSLPTNGNDDFNLAFIWSRPKVTSDFDKRDENDTDQGKTGGDPIGSQGENDERDVTDQEMPSGSSVIGEATSSGSTATNGDDSKLNTDTRKPDVKLAETEPVGEYYHFIRHPTIFLDPSTGEAEAHIELTIGSGTDVISIPGGNSNDFHTEFVNCARSVHLLAASYAYSVQESKKARNELDKTPFTFKEHANAIARFTRRHINRVLHRQYFLLSPLTKEKAADQTTQLQETDHITQAISPSVSAIPETATQKNDISSHKFLSSLSLPSSVEKANRRQNQWLSYLGKYVNQLRRMIDFVFSLSRAEVPPIQVMGIDVLTPIRLMGARGFTFIRFTTGLNILSLLLEVIEEALGLKIREDENARYHDALAVLTLLLDEDEMRDANHVFIEGLFNTEDRSWIPHSSMTLNPIKRVIDIRNERLLKIMIDHCIKNAHERHPGYLTPVIQCLSQLSKLYPDILDDVFRRASYIPARNPKFVASHAILANQLLSDLVNFPNKSFGSSNINDYNNPVFTAQSQLPCYRRTSFDPNFESVLYITELAAFILATTFRAFFSLNLFFVLAPWRKKTFPQKKTQSPTENRLRKTYVSPFQFKPSNERGGLFVLGNIVGRDSFDSPALQASLQFKWEKHGFKVWSERFVFVLIFFILVLSITREQISVSTVPYGRAPTADEIAARYLPKWQPAFIGAIVFGILLSLKELWILLSLELWHKGSSWRKISSLFNFINLAAYLLPVVGCSLFLDGTPGTMPIWIMGYGIPLLYLSTLFHLRIVGPLAKVIDIITTIPLRMKWFFLVFLVFLISFTHAFLYVLHTPPYIPCEGDACQDADEFKYPTSFAGALMASYFILYGRYDPVENPMDDGSVPFRVMMVIFFFFTVLILLNVLIAVVNEVYSSQYKHSYWKFIADEVANVELVIPVDTSRPQYVYYFEYDSKVEQFNARDSPENHFVAESSREAHTETQATQHMILQQISEMQRQNQETRRENQEMKQELSELKDMFKTFMQRDHQERQTGKERHESYGTR
ncbi:MAG: hypothetical protein J3Q66DRAFT_92536 [Benniella sp.]|nr:MAG: hypothetical protein J3Q66DRAFT_92536 [Benniella sp.]